jgi:hypothetical protein
MQVSEHRQAYEKAVDLANEMDQLIDALYKIDDIYQRMDQMSYIKNVQGRLNAALLPLVYKSANKGGS